MKLFNRLNKATMTFVFLLPLTPMVSFGQDTLTDGTVYYSSSFLNLEGLSTNEKILLIVSLLTLICIRSVHYFFFILPKRKKEIEAKRQRALQRERDKKSAEWRTKKQEIEKSIEKDRRKKLKISQKKIIASLDKDGNGEVDDVEGNDFDTLLQKHQKAILAIDRTYIDKFIKVSSYLRDKKANIQNIFYCIEDTPDETALKQYVGILKNEVNTYHMILANGLTMIVALVKDEVITYSRIYESMDRINIFDSQWEKDVSQKLTNIGEGLNALMYEIEASNRRIVNELSNLTYATEEGFRELNGSITSELQSIDSSIKFNNLLTGIQTYQMYKINKNTKSLND